MPDNGAPMRKPLFPFSQSMIDGPGPHQSERPSDFGLGDFVRVLRRRLWVFGAVSAAVFLLVALYTATSARIYQANVQVQLNLRPTNAFPSAESVVTGLSGDTAAIDTETTILGSRKVAELVVESLKLTDDAEFAPPKARPSLLKSLLSLTGSKAVANPELEMAQRKQIAVTNLQAAIKIQRSGLTYIVDITAKARSAEKAALIANAYAEAYLNQQLEAKYDAIARVNEWLNTRLSSLREEVRVKERAVEAVRAESGLTSVEGSTLTEQALSEISSQLIEARASLAERQARLRSVREGTGSGDAAEEALQSPVIASLRGQQAELARQKAELSAKYDWKHPEIRRITDEIADIDSRVDQEVARIVSGLRNQVEVARQRVASIEASLSGQRSELAGNNVAAVRFRELDRDAESSRVLYEAFLNKAKQVAEQVGIEQADASIVSRANPPLYASFPNTKLNYVIGLALGVLLGLAAVVLMELLETSLRSAEDVQQRLRTPCLGNLPMLDKRARTLDGELISPENFVVKRPLSPFGEALRGLRASVFFSNAERQIRVLAVTSAVPGEGKTTTATGLARISALAGSKTILVDCDLRRRSATHALGLQVEQGLVEVLMGNAKLSDVLQLDAASGMDVLPLAQAEFTPRDLLSGPNMVQLINQLRARYEVIILDTAPVLPLSDSRVLCPLADGVLLIVRWGRTPSSVAKEAMELLTNHGARVLGAALDGVDRGIFGKLMYDQPEYYADLYNSYYVR